MKLYQEINKKLKIIYKEYKEDEEDLTGWGIWQKLRHEAGYSDLLRGEFIEAIFKIAYDESEIPLDLLGSLICCGCMSNQDPDESPDDRELIHTPSSKFFYKKTILMKVLEKLDLRETLTDVFAFLLCRDETEEREVYMERELTKKTN